MNLETQLPPALWAAISNNYDKRIYTAAIQDAIYYLSDLIRKRSGVDGDGASLVGQALGGADPKIKLTKLHSESDKNIQSGTEQILRGIYQAVRNPRSHGKHTDTQDDAIAIILFISYLVKQIDQARVPFSRDEFVGRVLESGYVPTSKYSNLLVAEIPPGEVLEVFISVYSRKDEFKRENAVKFFPVLLGRMNPEQRRHVCGMISDELKITDDEEAIRFIIGCFGEILWGEFEDIARIRIEHQLIQSIRKGKYDESSRKCLDGSLGTWLTSIAKGALLKEDALYAIVGRLSSDDADARAYGHQFFFDALDKLADEPPRVLVHLVKRRIKEKDRNFCEDLANHEPWKNELWGPDTIAAFDALKKELEIDDIPF